MLQLCKTIDIIMEAISYVVKRAVRFVLDYLALVVGYFRETKRGLFYLPPIADPILLETATSLAEKIRSGKVGSQ